MLYISTRSGNDAYTAHKTLVGDFATDGGVYVPFRMPVFTEDELSVLRENTFTQNIADILNVFFSARLTDWDIEFCIGRNICRLFGMNHRITVAELWHNSGNSYQYVLDKLHTKLCASEECSKIPTEWTKIAVEIAVLFGIYSELIRTATVELNQVFDICVEISDFSAPIAAWYARKMGLPVGKIVCTEKENGGIWDLIQRGTLIPAVLDAALLPGVERLIHSALGFAEVKRFRDCVDKRSTFAVDEENLSQFSEGLFCSVYGVDRAGTIINSVYRSNSYIMDPATAVCYGGLQDYRAKTGESRITVMLGRNSPMRFCSQISEATGLQKDKIEELTNLI